MEERVVLVSNFTGEKKDALSLIASGFKDPETVMRVYSASCVYDAIDYFRRLACPIDGVSKKYTSLAIPVSEQERIAGAGKIAKMGEGVCIVDSSKSTYGFLLTPPGVEILGRAGSGIKLDSVAIKVVLAIENGRFVLSRVRCLNRVSVALNSHKVYFFSLATGMGRGIFAYALNDSYIMPELLEALNTDDYSVNRSLETVEDISVFAAPSGMCMIEQSGWKYGSGSLSLFWSSSQWRGETFGLA